MAPAYFAATGWPLAPMAFASLPVAGRPPVSCIAFDSVESIACRSARSPSARLYSFGNTLTNLPRDSDPVVHDVARAQRTGPLVVVFDQLLQDGFVRLAVVPVRLVGLVLGRAQHLAERDHRRVAARRERAVFVVHVGHAAAHAGGEVAARLAEHGDGAAGHVFAAVVSGAFDDRGRAREPHGEALAGHAAEERLAAGRAVQHGVADDDVLRRVAAELDARTDRDAPAAHALAGVVVRVADQVERDALREERAEALAARAFHLDEDGVVGQAFGALADQLAGEHRADRAVDVAHLLHELHLLAASRSPGGTSRSA